MGPEHKFKEVLNGKKTGPVSRLYTFLFVEKLHSLERKISHRTGGWVLLVFRSLYFPDLPF